MGTRRLVVATTMMWVPATEAIVIVIVAAKFMLWMLTTEAVVIVVLASTMPWIVATEAVFVVIAAKAMARVLLAEAAQAGRLLAQAMLFVPATETTQVNVLKQRFGAAGAIVIEQRPAATVGAGGRTTHASDAVACRVSTATTMLYRSTRCACRRAGIPRLVVEYHDDTIH